MKAFWKKAMGSLCGVLAAGWGSAPGQVVEEAFDYAEGQTLLGQAGGSLWQAGWTQDGSSGIIRSESLAYADSVGNQLLTSGRSVSTGGTATTRNFRTLAGGGFADGWISFLYHLPASNLKFEGLTFYRGSTALFSVSNPSTTTGPGIYLTHVPSSSAPMTQGQFGVTHLIVLKLTQGGGTNGADRVDLYVDPVLTGIPSAPGATIQGSRLDFNTIRVAGQDGSPLYVDEIRMGSSFAEVTPHLATEDVDSDGDGLTDAQEAVLGSDPNVSNHQLFQTIRQNPSWVGLYDAAGMLELAGDGAMYQGSEGSLVPFHLEIQQSTDLENWGTRRLVNREVWLPAGKQFLRLTLEEPK